MADKKETANDAKNVTYPVYDESIQIGNVEIADEVVAIIAGLAVMEVEGVASMAGNITKELIGKLGVRNLSKGVKVDVIDGVVSVEVNVNVSYGYNIPDISKQIQEKVKTALENMTGLSVSDVNVNIADVIVS